MENYNLLSPWPLEVNLYMTCSKSQFFVGRGNCHKVAVVLTSAGGLFLLELLLEILIASKLFPSRYRFPQRLRVAEVAQ